MLCNSKIFSVVYVNYQLCLTPPTPKPPQVFYLILCPVGQNEDGVGDLRIINAQTWHEGRYTCTAQTVVDSDTAYADLKVVGEYKHI